MRHTWLICSVLMAAFRFALPLCENAGATELPEQLAAKRIYEGTGIQGGLVIHLGCGDGRLTAALHASDAYLVHGLEAEEQNVETARQRIRSLGLYGQVSVERWTGGRLPYVSNLVNLLVISDRSRQLAEEEIRRVLAPQGVAIWLDAKAEIQGKKLVKPRPKEIDDWSHYLHGPDNNAVAHDSVVGPPRHLQWVGSPRWSRHHDNLASLSAMVSAGGRIFYILDEGQTATLMTPSKWTLVARDAFNGTILWKCPLADWQTRFWPLKSGPAQLPRRLVADGDTVFATLGIDVPLSALDAATGRKLRSYEGTKGTVEVLASGGVLFLLVDPALDTEKFTDPRAVKKPWWTGETVKLMAIQAQTGAILWQHRSSVVPLTLAVDQQRVLFHDGQRIVCLDRGNGSVLWRSQPVVLVKNIMSFFAPTLVVQQGVVLFAGGEESGLVKSTFGATKSDTLTALDAQSGQILWTGEHPPSGYSSPEDVFVTGNSVWCGGISNGYLPGVMLERDLRTGQVKASFEPDVDNYWFHHRCYRGKATDKYLMVSRTGIEFVDVAQKRWTINDWIRGGCLYGIMPANGLIYTPPHDCVCYPESKQFGLNAVAAASAERAVPQEVSDEGRLEKGPAYGVTSAPHSLIPNPSASDWPTYRHDGGRSGVTAGTLPATLSTKWTADLGGRLSSMVAADGRLLVASIDRHSVHALAADTGRPLWSYTVGGRVDSPPTLYQGLVLFGSADGYVYCLRAADGALAWRFRAAPIDRRITAFEQIESLWPVSGSVLVTDGVVNCVAGRSMFLDGGLRLLKLEARSGRKLLEKVLDDRDPKSGRDLQSDVRWLNMPVALPDVLSTDGRYLYMRSQPFDGDGNRPWLGPVSDDRHQVAAQQQAEGTHLFCPTGFLDDTWWHRSYWVYGRTFCGGWNGYYLAGKIVPAGQLLVVDHETVFGYGRKPQFLKWTTPLEYQLFAAAKRNPATEQTAAKDEQPAAHGGKRQPINRQPAEMGDPREQGSPKNSKMREPAYLVQNRWVQDVPLLVRGMVLSGARAAGGGARTLFIAGPPALINETAARKDLDSPETARQLAEQDAALRGERGGILRAVSTTDGQQLAQYRLDAPPVWDGMIAAAGRLFVATTRGQIVCFAEK